MGHLLGAEKKYFFIRDIDGPAMTAASMESCRFVGCAKLPLPQNQHNTIGQIKGSDKKCFGVDGWVKPVMTSCDDSETTGETGMPVQNSWHIIEGRLY